MAAQGEADAPGGGTAGQTIKLKDLVPAATNTVNTTFIVLDKAAPASRPHHPNPQARGGEEVTCLALVADETAAAHFLLWGGECGAFEPGDIVRLTGGIFSYHRGNTLVLRAGRRGRAEKVGEFTMLFVETPNMSEILLVRASLCVPPRRPQEDGEGGRRLALLPGVQAAAVILIPVALYE